MNNQSTQSPSVHPAPNAELCAFLKERIKTTALHRAHDGHTIVASEVTGKLADWLFDVRAIILEPKTLDAYAEVFWQLYETEYPFQVAGMETAGIPLVSAIVMKGLQRGTPVNGFFMRKSRKREGLMRFIEGTPTKDPVVLVDDLINSGKSFDKQIAILERERLQVAHLFALLSFREDSAYNYQEKGIALKTLFSVTDFGLPLVTTKNDILPNAFETKWRFATPAPSYHLVVQKSAPVLYKSSVIYATDAGTMYALNKEDGSIVWQFTVGPHPHGKGILSTPLIYNGTVFFGAYDGNVYALNADTGELMWKNTDADWVGSSPSMSAEHNLLYIGLEFGLWKKRGGLAALDIKTGKTMWSMRSPEHTHASPLYIPQEDIVVCGSNDGIFTAHQAKTGAVVWRFATQGHIKHTAAYHAPSRTVICASMDGNVYALNAQNGEALWAYEASFGIYGSPFVHNNTVYVASLDKRLYALDVLSGKKLWSYETNGRIFATPLVHDGSVYIGSNDGCLYELSIEKGELLGRFQTLERIVNAPVFDSDTNRLFIPTFAGELFCVDHRAPERDTV